MIFKRLKRFWDLTKKEPEALKKLEQLTEEEMAYIPEIGDGRAVFFGSGSQEEFDDLQKEDAGMKPWYDRLKDL